jgi:hypothetical protein
VLPALLAVAARPVLAHGPHQLPHQFYRIGDLKLESGETILNFSVSYVTHETLNAKKSNAILMVTAISGNHHRFDFLIDPGQGAAHRHILHRLHRCDRQWADHEPGQLHGADASTSLISRVAVCQR